MDRLRRLSAHADSWNDKANACFYLAKGYFKQNQHKKGELMLDSMYSLLQSSTTPYMLEGAYPFGLDYYLKKGDAPNIERYAKAMLQEVDIRFNEQISKKVTEAMIAFQTEKKEQQLRLTQAELTNKELRVQQQLLLLILLLIILTLFTAWFFNKRRLYRVERQLSEQRIAGLLSDFQTATSHSQQIEQQLSELLSDKENYLQAATITPQLFRESGENKFRERFSLLYPAFLQTLRERVPNITNNEEILSMLIVLEQSTDQMVDILCIARGSVNMARHRLRQKMGLQKEESLDDVIRGLLAD